MVSVSDFVGGEVAGVDEERSDGVGEVVVKWFGAGVAEAGDVSDVVRGDEGVDGDADDGGRRRRLVITAAVGSEDRKGDLIDPEGWELDGFRRNPVFLWAHDRSLPPIGKAAQVWVDGGALKALVEFAPTAFAGQVAELYAKGFMRGVSVGFIPLETEMREASSGRRGYLYKRQELLEISAVPVPMHARALAGGGSDEVEMDVGEFLEMRSVTRSLWRAVVGMGEL